MQFKEELAKINIDLTSKQEEQFALYYKRLVEVNSYMNLTAITEHDEVYNKHFYDSLLLAATYDLNTSHTLCDVGAGAGFPSIPLAICFPNLKVTIIDSLNKRIKFLNDLIKELGLTNVEALHYRAEDYAKIKRESFDIVTARAVARLNILSELCLPLVKIGGVFIAMKGQNEEEFKEASKGINLLGANFNKEYEFDLLDNAGKRHIYIYDKIKKTPKPYPRAFKSIKSNPL